MERQGGKVVWFKETYGFVRPDAGGKDLFVHHTALKMDGYKTLKEGQRVTFGVEMGTKGPQACEVEVV